MWMMILACAAPREGVVVGNPVKEMSIGSPGAEDWDVGTASISEVLVYGPVAELALIEPGEVDLLDPPRFEIEGDAWSRIVLVLDGPIRFVDGDGEVLVDIAEIEVFAAEPITETSCYTLEIGQPHWLEDAHGVGAEARLRDVAGLGSALYEDPDCSGIIDDTERQTMALATGIAHPEHVPDAAPFFVVAGEGGRRMASYDGGWTWENDQYESIDPTNPRDDIRGLGFGAGRVCGVGANSTNARSLTSFDGDSWETAAETSNIGWHDVAHGGGVFVAVGAVGERYWSYDGLSWEDASTGNGSFKAIAHGDGRFVAVGADALIAHSDDGRDWVDVSPPTVSSDFHAVAFGDGVWVVGGTGGQRMRSSDQGATWDSVDSASSVITSIEWTGTFFAAASTSQIMTSFDGQTWDQDPNDELIVALMPGEDSVVGIDYENRIYVAQDLSTEWTKVFDEPGGPFWEALEFAP